MQSLVTCHTQAPCLHARAYESTMLQHVSLQHDTLMQQAALSSSKLHCACMNFSASWHDYFAQDTQYSLESRSGMQTAHFSFWCCFSAHNIARPWTATTQIIYRLWHSNGLNSINADDILVVIQQCLEQWRCRQHTGCSTAMPWTATMQTTQLSYSNAFDNVNNTLIVLQQCQTASTQPKCLL